MASSAGFNRRPHRHLDNRTQQGQAPSVGLTSRFESGPVRGWEPGPVTRGVGSLNIHTAFGLVFRDTGSGFHHKWQWSGDATADAEFPHTGEIPFSHGLRLRRTVGASPDPANRQTYVPKRFGKHMERRDEVQHKAIPNWVIRALQRHGVAVRRSPSWIEEAHSAQLIQHHSARSALSVK